jgi:hypothetical protein
MDKTNRWHPCLLPDDFVRKMKRAMEEVGLGAEDKEKDKDKVKVKVKVEVEAKAKVESCRQPDTLPVIPPRRRATSESYYEPFPDDPPLPDDD